MVGQEIVVRRGSVLSPVTEIWYCSHANLLKRASGAYIATGTKNNMVLTPMFESILAPATLTAPAKDSTSVTLTWGAVTGAVKYQILQRNGAVQGDAPYTVRKEITPADGTAWTTRTWKITGSITKGSDYIFSVRAIDAAGLVGPETNPAIKYNTGQPEVRSKSNGNVVTEVSPSGTDQYDEEKNWTRDPGRPAQGFASGSTQARNRYGCIDFKGLRAKLINKHNEAIVDNLTLVDAYIQDIGRGADGGNATVVMRWHAGRFAIGVNTPPVLWTDSPDDNKSVTAPRPADNLGHHTDVPNGWVREWIKKSPAWNGLVLYRADGGGASWYAGVASTGYPNSWDLVVTYSWNFVVQPFLPISAVPWTFVR